MNQPPVFVIGLPESGRRARIADRLRELAIPFRLIDAIDGRKLTAEEMRNCHDETAVLARVGRSMGRGEIGCALSHRMVYRTMREDACPAAVILEEDAEVGEDFAALWRNLGQVPGTVELLSFHAAHGFIWRRAEFTILDFCLHRAASPLTLTVGYFVRLVAAEKLSRTPRVEGVADWPVDHGVVRHYLALPMPVGHPPRHSALAEERTLLQEGATASVPFRILRAVLFLSFLPFLWGRSRYASLQNYVDREVGWRLLRHFTAFFIDVAELPRQNSAVRMWINSV